MRSTDIVAYTYQAELLCPSCAVLALVEKLNLHPPMPHVTSEDAMDFLAQCMNIDRADESSFDSDEFPKVVFADSIDYEEEETPEGYVEFESEQCDSCGAPLLS